MSLKVWAALAHSDIAAQMSDPLHYYAIRVCLAGMQVALASIMNPSSMVWSARCILRGPIRRTRAQHGRSGQSLPPRVPSTTGFKHECLT